MLGDNELVLDWASLFTDKLLSITFSAEGDMYIGTDAPEGIIILHEDGSYEGLYPGVIEPESYALCWGNGLFLYVTRRSDEAAKNESSKSTFRRMERHTMVVNNNIWRLIL